MKIGTIIVIILLCIIAVFLAVITLKLLIGDIPEKEVQYYCDMDYRNALSLPCVTDDDCIGANMRCNPTYECGLASLVAPGVDYGVTKEECDKVKGNWIPR